MPVSSNQYLLLVGSVDRITVTEQIKVPIFGIRGLWGLKKSFFRAEKSLSQLMYNLKRHGWGQDLDI